MQINKYKYIICFLLVGVLCFLRQIEVDAKMYNMTYLYGSGNYISMIDETQNTLNEVSPSYFDIDENGNLILNTVDINLVNNMHSQGIKVVPFLSNHWDKAVGKAALNNSDKLSTDIVNAIEKYNLDGVNVDIENVSEKERTKYSDFVRKLREKLSSEKMVVVSVAANPYNWTSGWHASYDYAELAKYADYLMIMTYDEHFEGGEAGSVAGIKFVEDSIKYALRYVDCEKIVMGIPLYGRYWKEGASYGGQAISLEKIETLVNDYESTVTYDKETESVKAVIKIKSSDKKPKIYGKILNTGTYVIWYENEDSLRAKLNLVDKYNIKGVGTWRLGMEVKSMWDIFKEYIIDDEGAFQDVSSSYWANEAIAFLKEKGWVEGKGENKFDPEAYITRAEVAAMLCRILDRSATTEKEYYIDTKESWASKEINEITELGIVEGYADYTFRPEQPITRAEIAKILSSLLEDNIVTNEEIVDFSDVSSEDWAYKYIKKLQQQGIINGYLDNTYRPTRNVTRAEVAKMIYNIFEKR